MSKSATNPETPITEKSKQPELMINNNQLAGIESLRTKCNLPGAEDIEASSNRIIALNWLYRLSGRTNGNSTPGSGSSSKKNLQLLKKEV